jgi:hypothetical protein
MVWKEIRIMVAEGEQSVLIAPNPELDGMCLHSIEERDKDTPSFVLYLSFQEAKSLGQELIKYAEEMETSLYAVMKLLTTGEVADVNGGVHKVVLADAEGYIPVYSTLEEAKEASMDGKYQILAITAS